jgi:hypothetical protein
MRDEGKVLEGDKIISPYLDEFLVTWDGTLPPHVAKRVHDLLVEPQRNRSGSFSASSAGYCKRRQEFSFLGVKPPGIIDPKLATIFLNGRWVHLRWQATLMTAGILDNIEVTVKKPSRRARCTLDGVGTAMGGHFRSMEFGFELKGRNLFTWGTQRMDGPDDKTRSQVDFMFLLTGLEAFVILNESKNDQSKTEWVFTRDEDRVKAASDELDELNRAIDIGRLHPMLPECKLRQGEFKKCPFGGRQGPCANTGSWV